MWRNVRPGPIHLRPAKDQSHSFQVEIHSFRSNGSSLDRHRRTFSAPLLGEERDAMWIQALVKAGRYDDARTRAAAFRRRSPDSLFTSVVDSAIGSIP